MLAARARLVPSLPLMRSAFSSGRPGPWAVVLSTSVFRSKAVWRYDAEFMPMMPVTLGIACEDIATCGVWVACSGRVGPSTILTASVKRNPKCPVSSGTVVKIIGE